LYFISNACFVKYEAQFNKKFALTQSMSKSRRLRNKPTPCIVITAFLT
jgi:hypothetical protein